jgi:hypothetical protein
VVALVLVLIAGCTASKVARNATITVHGTALAADGRPLAGAKVVLVKEADLGEALFGLTLFAATLGTACLVDPAPAICGKAHRTTAADDGSYSLILTGRDTQGLVGNASTFHLSVGMGDRGPTVSARFQIQGTDIAVPPLQLWAPKVDVTTNRTFRTDWIHHDAAAVERLVFFDTPAGNTVWIAEGKPPLSLDPRIVEDGQGALAVDSDTKVDKNATTFELTHQSAMVDYAGSAGPPPSRNAACTPSPCALTDGNLGPPPTGLGAATEVSVDLGVSRVPALIVVRGCPGDCKVDTSPDGTAWTVVGSSGEPFFEITPVTAPPIRYVRVSSTSALDRLAEVSVW